MQEVTNEHIRQVLSQIPNVHEAARILGIDAATIYHRKRRRGGKPEPRLVRQVTPGLVSNA